MTAVLLTREGPGDYQLEFGTDAEIEAKRIRLEVAQMLEGLTPWRRCMRRGCGGWTRGEFCPRHVPAPAPAKGGRR